MIKVNPSMPLGVNERFGQLPNEDTIERVARALGASGIQVIIAASGAEARAKVGEIIPAGASVMNMTSATLEALGIDKDLLESGRYVPVRAKLQALDPKTQGAEMRSLGAVPDWCVGSVHAVTEDGRVIIASATGSQLPAYAYGAAHVLWVVGAQKIVQNLEEGLRRLNEYSLPLEDERARKVYGVGSGVNKVLIVNREFQPNRITLLLVKEKLGF